MTNPDTVAVDLDGTLANIDHRTHLVQRPNPDWDRFFAECVNDKLNVWCAELMKAMGALGYNVVIVSARSRIAQKDTIDWLTKNGVQYNDLYMLRPAGDTTPDTVLKKRWLDQYGKERILFVVDDRQKVVDAWRAEGVTCLQCYAWPEYKRPPRR